MQDTDTLWVATHPAASLPSDTVSVMVGAPAIEHVKLVSGDVAFENEPDVAVHA